MKHWSKYNLDDARHITKQNILKHLSCKPYLIKKCFLIISDELILVTNSRDEILKNKEVMNGRLFPKYIVSKPDEQEKDYAVIYIGPICGGITTTFFYFKKEELVLSFLRPKKKPSFSEVTESWVKSGKECEKYIKYLLDKYPETENNVNTIYKNIYYELNYLVSKLMKNGIPQRFKLVFRTFIETYILGRWWAKECFDDGKLHNIVSRPVKPYELKIFCTDNPKEIMEEVKHLLYRSNGKFKKEIGESYWSPIGLGYRATKRNFEKMLKNDL